MAYILIGLIIILIVVFTTAKIQHKQADKIPPAGTVPTITPVVLEEVIKEEQIKPAPKKKAGRPKSDNPTKTMAPHKPKKKDGL